MKFVTINEITVIMQNYFYSSMIIAIKLPFDCFRPGL